MEKWVVVVVVVVAVVVVVVAVVLVLVGVQPKYGDCFENRIASFC